MKVWLKLLIGSLLGIVLGMVLPAENDKVLAALGWIENMAIRIGSYTALPILLFSLTIGIYELRQDGAFWPLVFRSMVVLVAAAALVIAVGVLATVLFPPARIPILIEEQGEFTGLNTGATVLQIFPLNMLSVIAGDGIFLFPAAVFAFLMGIGLSYDKSYTKPVITLIDSLSRIFYHIASFLSEILALVLIALAAYWAVRFRTALNAGVFKGLLILLAVLVGSLAFIILPLFIYIIKPKTNPWVVLYGCLGQAISALFSGNLNFTLPVTFRHLKENLGVRRRSSAVTMSLFTVLGRAGSAMTAAVAFIVIIQSYSSLGLDARDLFVIGGRAFLISFLLAARPGDGAYIALAALCAAFGKGYEAGYLIIKPIAFYLIAVGAFLDVMIASFASFALARASGLQEDKSLRYFI
ncbi:MAG: cation:dicarboxylase symporter family transporter [Treponema sp.]|jgi:Na+/H+-dicarboxylate symporter|nr:cation:dicarboxylase symporter family transporter [Treponema sp.]